jgi:TonB family protein
MSPPAAGMALALHLTVALTLWWVSPLKFVDWDDEPIEVTMEAPPPKPAQEAPVDKEPAASASAAQAPAPSRPSTMPPPPPVRDRAPLGLPPAPPPGLADKPVAKPSLAETPQPSKGEPAAPPAPPQQAMAPPKLEPEPTAPPVDKVLPRIEAPPPPLSMQDLVKIPPPPAPHEIARPPQQVTPTQPAPQQALRPSPLSPHAPPESGRGSPSSTFVNPANIYSQAKVEDAYIWQMIAPRIARYHYLSGEQVQHGPIVLRLAIMRDGRLANVTIDRSSGSVAVDKGVLEAVRAGSPYPPLLPEIEGDPHIFVVPLTPQFRR